MIEFTGNLTGEAEKYFLSASSKYRQKVSLLFLLMWVPTLWPCLLFSSKWLVMSALLLASIIIVIIKYNKKYILKQVTIEDDVIIYEFDKLQLMQPINTVKKVQICDEYYILQTSFFKFFPVSDKFVCQKDLLAKGTLEEFEALFEEKTETIRGRFCD